MAHETRTDEEARTTVDEHGREFIAKKHRFPANGSGFLIAPVLWMVYFVSAYSLQGAGCAEGLDGVRIGGGSMLNIALGTLTALFATAIALAGIWSFVAWRRLLGKLDEEEEEAAGQRLYGRSAFLAYGALLHAGLFFIATLWSGIPIVLVGAC